MRHKSDHQIIRRCINQKITHIKNSIMKRTLLFLVSMYMISGMAPAMAQNQVLTKTVQTSVTNKIENPTTINRDITSELNAVTVKTVSITNITDVNAWCTYSYRSDAGVSQHGICVSKGPSPTIQNTKFFSKGVVGPEFGAEITGLSPGSKYYVRAFAKNSSGTVFYGNELNFITLTPKK